MKRLMIFAAALMFTNVTSLTFAHDETASGVQKNIAPVAAASAEPVMHHKVKTHHVTKNKQHTSITTSSSSTKPVTNTGTENSHASLPSSQPAVNTNVAPSKAAPTSMNEKKSEPVAENKPAATLTDAAKTTVNTATEHVQGAAAESVKSTVPTPSLPTAPTAPVAKTVTAPTNPTTPAAVTAPATMPTK